MKITSGSLQDVLVIEPRIVADSRGFFLEAWNQQQFLQAGIEANFVQDIYSRSRQDVLRGLHYQIERPQGKLIWAVRGEVYDVVVDLRQSSPTFGRWMALNLSAENHRQVYVPPGMAHGFCTLSAEAELAYKCTDFYYPDFERTIVWNDPQLAISWPVGSPVLSDKDQQGLRFSDAPHFA